MAKIKPCKFEESIIAKLGWSEKEFNKFYLNILNLKIINNILLTPQETKDFIALRDDNDF